MTRECERSCAHRNYWLMQMIGLFLAKRNFYFIFSATCSKNVPTPLVRSGVQNLDRPNLAQLCNGSPIATALTSTQVEVLA